MTTKATKPRRIKETATDAGIEERLATLETRIAKLEEQIAAKPPERRDKIGMTIEAAREYLNRPAERTPEDIEQALSLIGILGDDCDLPTDLSENWHDYRYMLKKWA